MNNAEFRKGWAEPDRTAQAIYEVVTRGKTIPIRFPLGTASFGILREEIDTMAKEFDEIKSISLSVDSAEQASQLTDYQKFS